MLLSAYIYSPSRRDDLCGFFVRVVVRRVVCYALHSSVWCTVSINIFYKCEVVNELMLVSI